MTTLRIDLWDSNARDRVEKLQWDLTMDLLTHGQSIVIEWGTWARSERDTLRTGARAVGSRVELHFLHEPVDVLMERVGNRARESPPIELEQLKEWSAQLERPSASEMALFDPVSIAVSDR